MQDKDTILKALRHQSRFFTPQKTKTGVMGKAQVTTREKIARDMNKDIVKIVVN